MTGQKFCIFGGPANSGEANLEFDDGPVCLDSFFFRGLALSGEAKLKIDDSPVCFRQFWKASPIQARPIEILAMVLSV